MLDCPSVSPWRTSIRLLVMLSEGDCGSMFGRGAISRRLSHVESGNLESHPAGTLHLTGVDGDKPYNDSRERLKNQRRGYVQYIKSLNARLFDHLCGSVEHGLINLNHLPAFNVRTHLAERSVEITF